MGIRGWQIVVLRALFLLGLASTAAAQGLIVEPADLIVIHARVYTENPKQPWAAAVAIRGSKIVAVGEDATIEKRRGMGTRVINAAGKLVLPGLMDCHVRFLDGSLSLGQANLADAKDLAALQKKLRSYGAEHLGDAWILGRGWSEGMFGPEAPPHKKYLDELFPDRPVFLLDLDAHNAWVNSKALAVAGVTRQTPDPPNGVILRDSQTGEATGVLQGAARDLVLKFVPDLPRPEKFLALRTGMKRANQLGITGMQSAGGDFQILDLLEEMRRRGDLTLRMYIPYFAEPPQLRSADISSIEAAHKKYHDDWLDTGVVHFMLDGGAGSHSAAMLEPYADDPSTKGKSLWDSAQYNAAVAEADKHAFQVSTFATGDYSVRLALDVYANFEQHTHKHDARPRIAQLEMIAPADLARFGELGVFAIMQPLQARPDFTTLNVLSRSLGPERTSRAWAWKSILEAGGRLAFGSGWPDLPLNPWEAIQMAVTRQTAEGNPSDGFLPEQRLSVEQAVGAYTLGAAFATRHEKTQGSLEEGKLADLIIISQDIFSINPHRIGSTRVLTTIVGGRVVYQVDKK